MGELLKAIARVAAGNSAPNKNEFSDDGVPFVRTSSLEFLVRNIPIDNCEKIDSETAIRKRFKLFPKGSIIFAKSGMSAKICRIYVLPKDAYVVSHLAVVTIISNEVNNQYVAYYLNYRPLLYLIKDDAYPSISITDIENVEIPLPNLEAQNKIVTILDKAKSLLDKVEQTIPKYNELLQAIFLEMFGDPMLNPKGWEIKSLLDFGDFKNGLNYKSDETGFQMRCLGVGDFKTFWKLSNIDKISKINLTRRPSEDYYLQNDDLVFVRSNGNKELVGRCMVVQPGSVKITFSGFCIRYRTFNTDISPIYLAHLFRNATFRQVMLQNGRGANIQNINQRLLGDLQVPYPSKDLQLDFERVVESLQSVLLKVEIYREQGEKLLKSLSQQVFSERITIDVDAELEALINAVDLAREDENNKIDTVVNDIIFIQRLIDRLQEQEFEGKEQYDKAKYILFRMMKEVNLVKQIFKDDKVQLTFQNETT